MRNALVRIMFVLLILAQASTPSTVETDEFSAPATIAHTHTHEATIHTWAISPSSKPIPYAKIQYTASGPALGAKFTLLSSSSSSSSGGFPVDNKGNTDRGEGSARLVRIGFPEQDSWTVTTHRVLSAPTPRWTVWIDPRAAGKAWRVEVSTSPSPDWDDGDGRPAEAEIKKINSVAGILPFLNQPVVLTPDGSLPETEGEKTFFQKYWWLLLAGFLLIMSVGGGGE